MSNIYLCVYALGVGRTIAVSPVSAFVYVHTTMATLVRSPRAVRADTLGRTHVRVTWGTLTAPVARFQVCALYPRVARFVQIALHQSNNVTILHYIETIV